MFSSIAKRSSYKVIEEEGQSPMSSGHGQNLLQSSTMDDEHEEQEEAQHEESGRSMFESAPPISHGIAISFKCGENDPEVQKSNEDSGQWDHIKDIDQFFVYIYEYYQQKGFTCIALRYLFSLLRFAFVVFFSTFLFQCIDYDVLFYNGNTTLDGAPLPPKRGIQDAFIPQCYSRLNPLVMFTLFLATLFWIVHLFRICYRLIQFYEIKRFFTTQLQITDAEMQNMSWSELVQKLCLLQQRLHLIVNRDQITSLDIYQRILRHKNYFIGLVYHDILPPSIRLPFIGNVRYLSTGFRFNLEWFLFWGPWSPWKGPYALKDEYKEVKMLPTISQNMQRTVAIMAMANLIFFPFVFIYQVLFTFFTYAEHFQRDPNVFGMRKYSNYGREKLRHFNEMDHELDARLNRSYEFAARYTDQFISPLSKIIARNIAFVATAFFVVFCALTAIDEDTLKIEHVTTIMTLTGGIVLLCRAFIPNENLVYCQQFLMRQIVANIHYAPKSWLRNAHSTEIHREFTQIFRLKMEILVEELLSPILTPFILYFGIYKRVPEIVTFLHENTVHVDGLGDVCSLAQMDVARDGDVRLASLNQSILIQPQQKDGGNNGGRKRGRNGCGKAELSLLNFAAQNPDWIPPKASAEFIQNVRELVALEISNSAKQNSNGEENLNQENICGARQIAPNSSMDAKTMAFVVAANQMPLCQMEKSTQGILTGMASTMDGMETSRISLNPTNAFEIPLQPMYSSTTNPSNNNNDENTTTSASGDVQSQSMIINRRQSQNNAPSTSSSIMNTSQPQPLPFLLGNSRLFASSFIAPSPLAAIVQPRAIQESNLRATEMSLNALAVNHMLFLNTSMEQHLHQTRQNRAANRIGGYGSIFMGNSIRRGYGGMGTTIGMDSLAESNIWGVPAETSQILGRMRGPPAPPAPPAAEGERRQNNNNLVDADAPLPLMEEEEQGRLLQ